MLFSYNYSHFQYSFCNLPVLFAHLENVNKLWKNNPTVDVNKLNQKKKKKKRKEKKSHITFRLATHSIVQLRIQLTNSAIVSLKDGLTVWRQSQKKDFLSMICLVMAQLKFFLIKKIKIERAEDSLILHSFRPITSDFCLSPTPPNPQIGHHMCMSPYLIFHLKSDSYLPPKNL